MSVGNIPYNTCTDLGSWLVRSITVAISFMPPKAIRRVFPPMVSGVTIILIGVALITAGFQVQPSPPFLSGLDPLLAENLYKRP